MLELLHQTLERRLVNYRHIQTRTAACRAMRSQYIVALPSNLESIWICIFPSSGEPAALGILAGVFEAYGTGTSRQRGNFALSLRRLPKNTSQVEGSAGGMHLGGILAGSGVGCSRFIAHSLETAISLLQWKASARHG
jgi:hypothetical protein